MSSSLKPISLTPSPRPPRLPIFKTYIYRTIPERKSPLHSQDFVPELQLPIDIYIPHHAPSTSEPEQASPSSPSTSPSPTSTHPKPKHPVLLSIHGGAWIASNKLDYPPALFSRFLEAGFVIASPDYRLLPESTFEEQCSDIAALEKWLREDLGEMLGKEGDLSTFGEVDGERIVVTGASAGAHLALLTVSLTGYITIYERN
jgi:acetyl esterase/lipase